MVKDTNYTAIEDKPLIVAAPGILAGAADVDNNTLTVVGHSAPAHGNVTVNPDGSFTYVPGPDFNGIDSFIANVSDGSGGYASATITIGVGGCLGPHAGVAALTCALRSEGWLQAAVCASPPGWFLQLAHCTWVILWVRSTEAWQDSHDLLCSRQLCI